MNDEFANRQNMHLTVLALLDNAGFHPVWQNQPPAAFTARAAELRTKVDALGAQLREQQTETAGHAADKAREEAELETLAHEIGQALAGWFEDHGREADAAPPSTSPSTPGSGCAMPRCWKTAKFAEGRGQRLSERGNRHSVIPSHYPSTSFNETAPGQAGLERRSER